jgi:hypothetical protein
VTNRHVVAGAAQLEVRDSEGRLLATFNELSQRSFSVDLVITPQLPTRTPTLSLSKDAPAVGDRVVVIGAPLGLENTVSDGIVSAFRTTSDTHLLQMTAPVSPGSSGGPVLNERGEVVAITALQLTEGQNLNFAILSSDLRPLYLSQAGHFAFPPAILSGPDSTSTASVTRTGPSAPVLRGLLASLPKAPIASIDDTDFQLQLYGCYGDPKLAVVVCALNFHPVKEGNQRLNIYEAALEATTGGTAGGDVGSDTKKSYRIHGDNDWMPVENASDVPVLLRFITRYEQGVHVQLGLRVGGPLVKRNQAFAPVPIIDIDSSVDASWIFGR